MANYILRVPELSLQSDTKVWASRQVLTNNLLRTYKSYKPYIDAVAKDNNIPIQIILGFIIVESMGRKNVTSGGGTVIGLMQWTVSQANGVLKNEYIKGRFSENELSVLKKYGFVFDKNGNTKKMTVELGLKPELNILIGAIWLGQIIDGVQNTTTGWAVEKDNTLRIDKIISAYNGGSNSKQAIVGMTSRYGGKDVDTSTIANYYNVVKKINIVSASYISKFLGKDGAMDILTSDLAYLFK